MQTLRYYIGYAIGAVFAIAVLYLIGMLAFTVLGTLLGFAIKGAQITLSFLN